MDPIDPCRDDEVVLRVIWEATRAGGGDPPVLQHVIPALLRRGMNRPDECLEALSPDVAVYRGTGELDDTIQITPIGLWRIEPDATAIHGGFIPALRGLVEHLRQERPESPTRSDPLIVPATQLFPGRLDAVELRIVGHFLAAEEIGSVEWGDDPESPWSIGIDLQILGYARVLDLAGYAAAKSEMTDPISD